MKKLKRMDCKTGIEIALYHLQDEGWDEDVKVVAALQATIDMLPKHADTGEAFVPGRVDSWGVDGNGRVVQIWRSVFWKAGELGPGMPEVWHHFVSALDVVDEAYSTEQAALAAKENQ